MDRQTRTTEPEGPSAGSPTAVVFSVSHDHPTVEPVLRCLDGQLEYVVINADLVASGEQQLTWWWHEGRGWLEVDGLRVDLRHAVGWWRKPHWFQSTHADPDAAATLQREILADLDCISGSIAESRWLNAPSIMRVAQNKVRQWTAANKCGLRTPPTAITNTWQGITAKIGAAPYAFKQIDGTWKSADVDSVAYTSRLEEADDTGVLPFPGLVQPFVVARVEWRVTVVDERVFATRIISPTGHRDWRLDQLYGRARFEASQLPSHVEASCRAVVRDLNLHFAAIDLVEDGEGAFWFLEANANGQYAWLDTDGQLSSALSSLLITLACT